MLSGTRNETVEGGGKITRRKVVTGKANNGNPRLGIKLLEDARRIADELKTIYILFLPEDNPRAGLSPLKTYEWLGKWGC